MNELLPIGSVVKLDKDSKIDFLIIGYYLVDEESNTCYQYAGTVFPSGLTESSKLFLFNHKDITDVLFEGYKENGNTFLSELQKEMES